jgi:hypothetical protein
MTLSGGDVLARGNVSAMPKTRPNVPTCVCAYNTADRL